MKKLLTAVAFCVAAPMASAANVPDVKIREITSFAYNAVSIRIEPSSGQTICGKADVAFFVIETEPTRSPGGKQMYAAALMAQAMDRTITLGTSGCYGGFPRANRILLK